MENGIHFIIRMALTILLAGAWVESGVSVLGWLALVNLVLMVLWGLSLLAEEKEAKL